MPKMNVVEVLAEFAYGSYSPICDMSTFCEYEISQSWCRRDHSRDSVIANVLTSREIENAKRVKLQARSKVDKSRICDLDAVRQP